MKKRNGKYNIADHKDEIITHIIKNLIWVPIAALIPIGFTILNVVYQNVKSNTTSYDIVFLIGFGILVLIMIIIIICYIKATIKTEELQNIIKECERDLEMRKAEISNLESNLKNLMSEIEKYHLKDLSFEVKFSAVTATLEFKNGRNEIISTLDYDMIVLAESISQLSRDIIWSGTSYNGTKLIEKDGDYELIDSDRTGSPYPYRIIFKSPLKKGNRVHFKTETIVSDSTLTMIPMYSFMVKYPTEKLTLKIIAPDSLIKNVKKAIYVDRAQELCLEKPSALAVERIMHGWSGYTYNISNPSMLYNYFIEWEFTK